MQPPRKGWIFSPRCWKWTPARDACAIGTNYDIQQYTRNTLFDEKIGGTCHFALGAGYPESGNNNQSGLHWDMVVDLRKGGYVEVDGIKINIDGKFTRDGFPAMT
jgi:aminopeptidase